MLAASIVEGLGQEQSEDALPAGMAYHFFTFRNASVQTCDGMLKLLIVQLASRTENDSVALNTFWNSRNSVYNALSTPGLLTSLKLVLQYFSKCYIVLDALDECDERLNLGHTLRVITGWALHDLHLLVTSQKEKDIEDAIIDFMKSPLDLFSISLESDQIDPDIES